MLTGFVECFGRPQQETGALKSLGLEDSDSIREFDRDVGCGVFADGLLSVGSIRESDVDLCGWASWVPNDARLFASSAFGILYLTRGDDVWVVDTQEGVVVQSNLSIVELILQLTTPELIRGSLRGELFAQWIDRCGALPSRSVLCPTPALALGGSWAVESLAPVTLAVYLAFTSALFQPQGSVPVDVRMLDGSHR
jgi:hypothetical protein